MAININNKKLHEAYFYLRTIDIITNLETQKVNGNPSNLDKIIPIEIQGTYSKKKDGAASKFMDGVYKVYYEMAVVYLVAEFERVLFQKFSNSYGEIKKVVKNKTATNVTFYKSREDFVKTDDEINKLSALLSLAEKQIDDQNLIDKVKNIKSNRDFIAHGKRYFRTPSIEIPLDEIVVTLDEYLAKI